MKKKIDLYVYGDIIVQSSFSCSEGTLTYPYTKDEECDLESAIVIHGDMVVDSLFDRHKSIACSGGIHCCPELPLDSKLSEKEAEKVRGVYRTACRYCEGMDSAIKKLLNPVSTMPGSTALFYFGQKTALKNIFGPDFFNEKCLPD